MKQQQQFNNNWDGIYRNLVTEAMAHYEANSRFPMSPIGTTATPANPAKFDDTSNSEANAKTFFQHHSCHLPTTKVTPKSSSIDSDKHLLGC